jgi:hypothetical protein
MDLNIEVYEKNVNNDNDEVKLTKIGEDKAQFLGIAINDDAVTKLLTTNEDLIKLKAQR